MARLAPLTILGVLEALPRIQDMSEDDGLFVESMMAALSQTGPDAAQRLAEFAQGKGAKVEGPNDLPPSPVGRPQGGRRGAGGA